MIIDININWGNWPSGNLYFNSFENYIDKIESKGIKEGFISPIDGIFSSDPDIQNEKIIEKLKKQNRFKCLPIINPKLKNWDEILEKYNEKYKIKVVKILPSFHRYSIIEKDVYKFFEKLCQLDMSPVIQKRFEDERSKSPVLNLKDIEIKGIEKISNAFPDLKIIILCSYWYEVVKLSEKCKNLYFDISFIECLDTLASLLKYIPEDRVIFGSNSPFLYLESSIFKLKYSTLTKTQFDKISYKSLLLSMGTYSAPPNRHP